MAEPGPALVRGWTSWHILPLTMVDTAQSSLLNATGRETMKTIEQMRMTAFEDRDRCGKWLLLKLPSFYTIGGGSWQSPVPHGS